MRVQPIGPAIPFLMRFKNNDNTQQTTNPTPKYAGRTSFAEVLKDAECQPIKPNFKGHWPMYCMIHNEPIVVVPEPEDKKPNPGFKFKSTENPNGKLNYLA